MLAASDPVGAVTVDRWEERLATIWIAAAETVYPETYDRLTGEKQAVSRLIALIQQIVRYGSPATRVRQFIEEASQGIVTTSRRRIHTILRGATPSQVRDVNRALARLYRTEFVADRAARIALDNILRASTTFEDAAARQVAASTGRTYLKRWVSQGDSHVRPTHLTAESDNTAVALDDFFKVGGELLRYPRDPAGSLAETANCRCWSEQFVAVGALVG